MSNTHKHTHTLRVNILFIIFCHGLVSVCFLKKITYIWQDSQPWTTFRSSMAKSKCMIVFTVPMPWTSNPLLVPVWSLSFHAGLRPHGMNWPKQGGRSGHQITSLYLHHNIFPRPLLLHILSQYWQMLTHTPERILRKAQSLHSIFLVLFLPVKSLD